MTTNGGSVWDRGPADDEPSDESSADGASSDIEAGPTGAAQATGGTGTDGPGTDPGTTDPPDTNQSDTNPSEADQSDTSSDAEQPAVTEHANPWEIPAGDDEHDSVWSRGPAPRDVAPVPAATDESPAPVLPPATPPVRSRRRVIRRVRRPVALLGLAALTVLVGALAWSFDLIGGDDTAVSVIAGDSAATAPAPTPTVPSTLQPATTVPATTVPATTTTVPVTTVPATTVPATTVPATTTTIPATTVPVTTVPATTVPATTTTAAAGPSVAVVGRVAPCKFGPSCLIADFSVSGFETRPREFVCEFENGSRFTFRFGGDGAENACSTSSADGTITVEVAGIRSLTITR